MPVPDMDKVRKEIKAKISKGRISPTLTEVSVDRTSKIPPFRIDSKVENVILWRNETGGKIEFGVFSFKVDEKWEPVTLGTVQWQDGHPFLGIPRTLKIGTYAYKMSWQGPNGAKNDCVGNSDPEIIIR